MEMKQNLPGIAKWFSVRCLGEWIFTTNYSLTEDIFLFTHGQVEYNRTAYISSFFPFYCGKNTFI